MKYIFMDIDTQHDFLDPSGALYVHGAEKLLPTLDKISVFALDNDITVLASADAHAANDPEFEQFPAHCVRGTPGQRRVSETLPDIFFVQPNDGAPVRGKDLNYRNVLFEKQTFNLFDNPKVDVYLNHLKPQRVIVYGVATDYCVKAAVEGLLERGINVTLLRDAIKAVNPKDERGILSSFAELGVHICTFDELELEREP